MSDKLDKCPVVRKIAPLALSQSAAAEQEFGPWIVVLLVVAAAWSIASTRYEFATGDACRQVPRIMRIMQPDLLSRDILATDFAVRHGSWLFYVIAMLAKWTSLPLVYACLFVVFRMLTLCAYYHLAYVCTSARASAVLATLVLAGIGHQHLATYLSGVDLLLNILVPRAAALPCALMAIATMIRGRNAVTAAWVCLTFFLHPVSGLNIAGIYVLYSLLTFRELRWRSFLLSMLVIALVIVGYQFWFGGNAPERLFFDPQWRAVMYTDYVFLAGEIKSKKFWAVIIIGLVSLAVSRPSPLRLVYPKFAVVAAAGMALHYLTVDVLGIVPMLLACPQRAVLALFVLSTIAPGAMIVSLWKRQTPFAQGVAAFLFLVLLLHLHVVWIAVSLSMAVLLAVFSRKQQVGQEEKGVVRTALPVLFAATAVLAMVAIAPFVGRKSDLLGALMSPVKLPCQGLQDLARLGVTRNTDAVEAQLWIRDHSNLNDLIFPANGTAQGWELYSERSCILDGALPMYTFVSRDYAMRYADFIARLPTGPNVSWNKMVQFATNEGADWIVIDDRDCRRKEGDPSPAFTAGPYHVFRATSGGVGAAKERQ